MALRLTGPAPPERTLAVSELPSRAQQMLAAGNLEGYCGLLAQIEAIEDPHRRYWATMQLIERGLAVAAGRRQARRPLLLAALTASALAALEREPREPRLLNCAGIALAGLGAGEAAEAMSEAAGRLDPQLERVDPLLGRVDAKLERVDPLLLRAGAKPGQLAARRLAPADAAGGASARASVAELSRRAVELAALAQPVEGLRMSLCMIVRDEQEMLPRCLAAVVEAVDEIVVVDTGSADATIEIARSFGARVIEREWTGSFAEARNVSFEAATGDWLLYLDADEVLVREDAEPLRALRGKTWREAFYLSETNYTGELDETTAFAQNALRVFRNRPEYRFEGRLHEQIAHRLPGYLPERLEATEVRVEHYGYLGAVSDSREKSARNIELLRLQQAEGRATPFLHYNLGSEYAAAGDPVAALAELERSWQLLQRLPDRGSYRFAPALMSRLVKALRVCGRHEEAIARAREALRRFPDFTDLVLEQALAAAALGQQERAIELYERCIAMGDAPRGYTARVGSGTYLPRVRLAELRRTQRDLPAAIELLEHCLREHPGFVGSVLPYASALLASGVEPDAVLGEVERHVPDPSPAARFMLGTALYEAGAAALAEAQFRIVLAHQPHSGRARVALGEALLARRLYVQAAAEAGAIDGEHPLAVIAYRTELFARIAAGDTDGATVALQRARAAGMAPAELGLFTAWRELAAAGETAVELSSGAVEPLAVMLEALLRVHDFGAFEVLLGLLARTPLPERERRELIAEMYLRRGFAASAAEEWMSVCRREPDTRSLLGLARVAVARGMPGEARGFVAAALSRDPGNEGARSLLSELQAAAGG